VASIDGTKVYQMESYRLSSEQGTKCLDIKSPHSTLWQNKTISFVNFIFAPCILTNTPLPHLYFKIYNITPVVENFPSSCITTFF